MKNVQLFLRLCFLTIFFSLCSGKVFSNTPSVETLEVVEEGNFILHVVTQENTKIWVYIDGKKAVDAKFEKRKDNIDVSIPPHQIFQFNLKEGKHFISAGSDKNENEFYIEFETKAKTWATLYYVDIDKIKDVPGAITEPFSFEIRDNEIMYE